MYWFFFLDFHLGLSTNLNYKPTLEMRCWTVYSASYSYKHDIQQEPPCHKKPAEELRREKENGRLQKK